MTKTEVKKTTVGQTTIAMTTDVISRANGGKRFTLPVHAVSGIVEMQEESDENYAKIQNKCVK